MGLVKTVRRLVAGPSILRPLARRPGALDWRRSASIRRADDGRTDMVEPKRHFLRSCVCCSEPAGLSRRGFIASAVGAGAAAATGLMPRRAAAQAKPSRIDVHHHFAPTFHRDALGSKRGGTWPTWSPQMSLDDMDKNGIATAMLSVVQPGTWFGDVEETRALTRKLNDYGATLVRDHPGRYGMFACIAPPDVEGSLKEIEYGLDTLHANGIALLTSYGTSYLGDPSFAPVYAELNRRKAIVYVHPTAPNCCKSLVPGIPVGSIEYATDSTRTIAHLVFSGTVTKFPDIRWIFSHSGGTLPFLTGRFIGSPRSASPHSCRTDRCRNSANSITSWRRAIRRARSPRCSRWSRLRKCSTAPTIRSGPAPKSMPALPPMASAPPTSNRSSVAPRSNCCRG